MFGVVACGDPRVFRLPFGVEMELAALGDRPVGVFNGVAGGATVAQLRERDSVLVGGKHRIDGLDFGVREWVLDMPWPSSARRDEQPIVELWLQNHVEHIARAVEFDPDRIQVSSLRATLLKIGVVRGGRLMLDEELALLPPGEPLPSRLRGVMRTGHLHRVGLSVERRLLRHVGMRLAGGAALIRRVRAR
jgi:hypothetical protein